MYGGHTENVLSFRPALWRHRAKLLIPQRWDRGSKRATLVCMTRDWEGHLDRWTAASLVNAESASRIRAWERAQSPARGLSWPVRIALAFGAILLSAGVLLFVSAHWDDLSRAGRMSLLVATVVVLHGSGAAAARRFEGLGVALHAVGSVALGAAIAVAGQIFNLNEHWPAAVLLWGIGCAVAWLLLRHWTQAALCAILFPWWLAGEWDTFAPPSHLRSLSPIWVGICGLSFAYLSARRSPADSTLRKALMWLGGLALLPAAAVVASYGLWDRGEPWGSQAYWLAWAVALIGPLLAALALDARRALWNGLAIAWTLVLALTSGGPHASVATYAWCALGAAGLAAWGILDARPERVNIAVAGLAITVLTFYFSNVMDKLDRSASLIGIGLLFLGGGWVLERTRRHLLAHMSLAHQPKEAL
jgi:uncharacterized membrane protein